jgi:hypothetical protein
VKMQSDQATQAALRIASVKQVDASGRPITAEAQARTGAALTSLIGPVLTLQLDEAPGAPADTSADRYSCPQ